MDNKSNYKYLLSDLTALKGISVKTTNLLKKKNIKSENVLYMGDDIPDYLVMQKVGLPTCPQDAVQEIKGVSKYISHANGGKGAVRDVIEQVLKVQGKWMDDFDAKFF